MPRYAYIDHDRPEKPVIGWFDTDQIAYPKLPDMASLFHVEDDDMWDDRMASAWFMQNGKLVTGDHLTTPLKDQTLEIISAANPGLNGVYNTNATAQTKLMSVTLYTIHRNRFPGNAETYTWPDRENRPHVFPNVAAFQNFVAAVCDYVENPTSVVQPVQI